MNYTVTFADVIAAFVVGLLVMEWICEALRMRDLKEHNVALRELHERVVNYEHELKLLNSQAPPQGTNK